VEYECFVGEQREFVYITIYVWILVNHQFVSWNCRGQTIFTPWNLGIANIDFWFWIMLSNLVLLLACI